MTQNSSFLCVAISLTAAITNHPNKQTSENPDRNNLEEKEFALADSFRAISVFHGEEGMLIEGALLMMVGVGGSGSLHGKQRDLGWTQERGEPSQT